MPRYPKSYFSIVFGEDASFDEPDVEILEHENIWPCSNLFDYEEVMKQFNTFKTKRAAKKAMAKICKILREEH